MKRAPFVVAVVATSRHYGGPEEGGWWFDRTTVDEVHVVHSKSAAKRLARRLTAANPQPRFARSSAANRGEPDIDVRILRSLAAARSLASPPGRPRYS